uniref:UPF0481 protein At3g47200-like n=1 Tax=Erigeron canadensis TaxID=72917 RepID=UPI001CB9C0AB|nr:UPF0481 protein At3g47200-like [Erigeron canadensis]
MALANDDQKRNYVPIEVESLLRWAESREGGFVNQRPSICKVPSILRDLSPDSFKPQLVSIGPLHKEETNVQEIERLKRTYLHDLLKRPISPPKQPKTKLEDCLEKVNSSIAKIKSSYSATEYSEDQLANMMVMDGCFILEFCLKDISKEQTLLSKIQTFRISIDLMLLENQIPFFVLQDIFDLTKPDSISLSLTSLLHEVLLKDVHPFYISPNMEFPDEFSLPDVLNNSNHVHVLDCLHKSYQFKSSAIVDTSCGVCIVPWVTLFKYMYNMCGLLCSCLSKKFETVAARTALNYNHTVVELERSGVNFKPQEDKNKAMAMQYVKASACFWWPWRKPITFVMPTLIIQDFTEVVLRNFIAYEQFNPQVNYYFTSYSCIMDKLIDNEADVGTLVESRVLINHLGSYKDAATMINSICKNIQVIDDQFYYSEEIKALDEYYNSYWPNSFAHLRRTYFSTPWSFIALLAGITVLVFTVVPGIYTVMSYHN